MCESGGAVAINACPLIVSSASWARTIRNCMWSMQGRSRLEDVLVRIALFSHEMRTYGRIKKMKEE